MSAFNIQLPGVVIAGLYKKNIIQEEGKAVAGAVTAPAEIIQPAAPVVKPTVQPTAADTTAAYKFLGKNQQHVAIIVRSPGEAFLPEQHLQLLTKMLSACKLNLGDVAIVNDASRQVEINQLKAQLFPKQVLLFGIGPEETGLPLSFPMFKAQEYAGTTYLYTPSLDDLNQETEEGKLLKRKLWDNLKMMFGV